MNSHVIDQEAWARQSVFWQLGNISSEVGRAFIAMRQGKNERMISAFYRGIDLINATVVAWSDIGKSAYELLIAREQFAKAILEKVDDPGLETYFMQYALAARLQR